MTYNKNGIVCKIQMLTIKINSIQYDQLDIHNNLQYTIMERLI